MTRSTQVLLCLVLAACNKPSEESCKKAIANIRALMGTDESTSTADLNGDIRRCKGGSTKKAVECAAKAKTLDELRACDFMKVPDKKSGDGSSAAGSSAAGSSATGSSAAGSSADGSSAGGSSATGSSATGSSATGSSAAGSSAAGSSATGSSAAGSSTGSSAGSAAGSGAK